MSMPMCFYAEHDIDLRLGRTAVDLNPSAAEVTLDDGELLRYDRLLLTTGAEPRECFTIPGSELYGVMYLRSVEDPTRFVTPRPGRPGPGGRRRLDRGGGRRVSQQVAST